MTERNEHDTLPPSMDPAVDSGTIDPPKDFFGILKRLGPGLIIAGSIVGSGELIATTKTGAQAGITLLWLIIIGCLIKVFAQIELGRYAISHGETTLSALDRIPGPRLRANWILWFWFIMMLCTIAQLGGIVGGVGQALALTMPIKGDYIEEIRTPSQKELATFLEWGEVIESSGPDTSGMDEEEAAVANRRFERIKRGHAVMQKKIEGLGKQGETILQEVRDGKKRDDPYTVDDKIWAAFVAIFTAGLLFRGRYSLIQNISTVLVVTFTFITIGNVFSLQATEQWHIPLSDFFRGLMFRPPEAVGDKSPWITAIATFGIIGVGASELIAYPYWCLEKGYAKFAGERTDDESWAKRARGWMMVMHYDAFASMIVYTIATLAFFVMGVAVLYNDGLDPDGMRMVSTLAEAYVPVFGDFAKWLFLSGAISVLYSTFMVANAGNARMVTDAIKVFGLMDRDSEKSHEKAISALSVILPLLCLAVYLTGANPVTLVLVAGTMQAAMLPIVGFGAIYFRFRLTDKRLKPSPLWDFMLIVSFVGLFIAGAYGIYSRF